MIGYSVNTTSTSWVVHCGEYLAAEKFSREQKCKGKTSRTGFAPIFSMHVIVTSKDKEILIILICITYLKLELQIKKDWNLPAKLPSLDGCTRSIEILPGHPGV